MRNKRVASFKLIDFLIGLSFLVAVLEVICIKFRFGIPVLSFELSEVIINISYSYIAGYIFYILISKIPEIRSLPVKIQLGYYYVIIILSTVETILKYIDNDFSNLDAKNTGQIQLYKNHLKNMRNLLLFYSDYIDVKTMLRIEDIFRGIDFIVLSQNIEVEGGTTQHNKKIILKIIDQINFIRTHDKNNISIARKRIGSYFDE